MRNFAENILKKVIDEDYFWRKVLIYKVIDYFFY